MAGKNTWRGTTGVKFMILYHRLLRLGISVRLLYVSPTQIITMAEDKIGLLGEEALKRRERIAALKRKNEEKTDNDSEPQEQLPKPKFRSYKPQDETLKENVLEETKPGDVEAEVEDLLNAAKQKVVIEELDIVSLAPRKPDWDLKRDVAKKGEKLERRTQKAIAELIIERLKHGESEDLATAVNMVGNSSAEMAS